MTLFRHCSTQSLLIAALGLGVVGLTACESSTPGVKSNYVQQWTTVDGDLEEATEAAEEALSGLDLDDVKSKVTKVDGMAMAKQADGTEINVDIKPVTDETSEVTVRIGTVGDSELGNRIIADIMKNLED